MRAAVVATSLLLFGQSGELAASCDVYPEGIGQTVVDTPTGIKIISTAQASVPLDDSDLYMDGMQEATMEAKASIASFMNETVSKECESNTYTRSDIAITSEGKSVDVKKVKTILCSLKNSTSALLKGAVKLGSCYTPGQFVRVTVGIKPETIRQAERMSQQINSSAGSSAQDRYGSNRSNGPLNNMDGYSDDQRIYNF